MRRVLLAALVVSLAIGCGGSGSDGGSPTGPIIGPVATDPAEALFNELELNDVRLTMTPGDWNTILGDLGGNSDWLPAALEWKTERVTAIGVKPRPRVPENQKPTLHLKFDAFLPGQSFLGLQMLRLNGMQEDPSMARDRIGYAMFRKHMAAPRLAHCRLFVNGAYRGVYEVEEMIDGTMMRRRFPGELGNLYEMLNTLTDPYLWVGTDAGSYLPVPWRPVTNEGGNHFDVLNFIQTLNQNPAAIDTICDLETLITYFALEAVIVDMHGFTGDFLANNHFQYDWPQTGRFYIIPWDLAETFGDQDGFPTRSIFENFQRSLLSALIENTPALRARYKAKIGEIIEAEGHPAAIAARVDEIYGQLNDAAHADPYTIWGDSGYDWNRQFIKDFAQQRYDYLKAAIAEP